MPAHQAPPTRAHTGACLSPAPAGDLYDHRDLSLPAPASTPTHAPTTPHPHPQSLLHASATPKPSPPSHPRHHHLRPPPSPPTPSPKLPPPPATLAHRTSERFPRTHPSGPSSHSPKRPPSSPPMHPSTTPPAGPTHCPPTHPRPHAPIHPATHPPTYQPAHAPTLPPTHPSTHPRPTSLFKFYLFHPLALVLTVSAQPEGCVPSGPVHAAPCKRVHSPPHPPHSTRWPALAARTPSRHHHHSLCCFTHPSPNTPEPLPAHLEGSTECRSVTVCAPQASCNPGAA